MKIEQYAKLINEIAKKHPDAEVLYSSDDEGRHFDKVHYMPSYNTYIINGKKLKGICVN